MGRASGLAAAGRWIAGNKAKAAILAGATAVIVAILTTGGGADPREPALLERRETKYSEVSIYQHGDEVAMMFGRNSRHFVESLADRRDPTVLPAAYSRYMTAAAAYVPKPRRILEIGLGGGTLGWYMHKTYPEAEVTAVELDPDVAELAAKWFGIRDEPGYRTVVADGRLFLQNQPGGWDIIMVDAYRGSFVPYHLLTKEFYALARSKLDPDGVLAQNVEPTTMMFDSACRTMQTAFPDIDLYRTGTANIVAIGRPRAPDTTGTKTAALDAAARMADTRYHPNYPLQAMVSERRAMDASNAVDSGAKILDDDFAPVDTLRAITAHDRAWQEQRTARP